MASVHHWVAPAALTAVLLLFVVSHDQSVDTHQQLSRNVLRSPHMSLRAPSATMPASHAAIKPLASGHPITPDVEGMHRQPSDPMLPPSSVVDSSRFWMQPWLAVLSGAFTALVAALVPLRSRWAASHKYCEFQELHISSTSQGSPDASFSRRHALVSGLVLGSSVAMASEVQAGNSPNDEQAIRAAMRSAFESSIPVARYPAVLRLTFHDAGTYEAASRTGGANASVQFELSRPENRGLKRGLGPVRDAQQRLRGGPAEDVSLADLIYCAGAYAVEMSGGPKILVPLGRKDATVADPPNRLPEETLTGPELRAHFARGGFTTSEMVALSGAHSVGGKGFGDPRTFDNTYYQTLLKKPWLDKSLPSGEYEMAQHVGLPSDKALPEDPESLEWIQLYAADQNRFFEDFAKAYVKMSLVGTGLSA